MSYEANSHPTYNADALAPAAHFFAVGSELLTEVQEVVGNARIKSIRLTLGDRVLKEVPISPATVIGTVALVIGAIIISKIKVEIVKEPLHESS